MTLDSLKACVLALPEVAAWPEMVDIFERAGGQSRPAWELPLHAAQAVGGEASQAIPGAAAVACMQISIILVDDMLDQDPRGEYLRSGDGPTANLALAFQAAAFRLVEQSAVGPDRRAAVTASLAWLGLATALGQQWDVQNLTGEENYWKVIRAKSTPFYGAAFQVGALLGGASSEVAEGLRDFGVLLGEIIQIQDDVIDAFQSPANPDWTEGRNNLAILYALTANHPERARFLELREGSGDPQALRDAQQILVSCGAVSYCIYHLIKRYQQVKQLLGRLPLADSSSLAELLARQTQPLVEVLQTRGAEIPVELLGWPPA